MDTLIWEKLFMDDLTLEIKGFGRINEANIKLNKINVVGGINSSGKSTVSRFLYCFLKANVLNNEEYIENVLVPMINDDLKWDNFPFINRFSNIVKNFIKKDNQNLKDKDILKALLENRNFITSYILRDLVGRENIGYFEKGSARFFNSSYESLISNMDVDAVFDEGGFVESYGDEYDTDCDLYVIKTEGLLNCYDVFYIDSFSVLDLIHYGRYDRFLEENDDSKLKSHINYLFDSIYDKSYYHSIDECDESVVDVLTKIDAIIQGHVGSHPVSQDFTFVNIPSTADKDYTTPNNKVPLLGTGNISSGVKQVGIIQLLLSKEKLKPNSLLIIDEPEINLHPDWQFRFAEILVLLVKELDINLYLNSHSPMFIEAIDAFTEFYDMQDDVNYYLTEESNVDGKYDFSRITSDELYKLYDNLGNAYDLIDELRLRKHLGD